MKTGDLVRVIGQPGAVTGEVVDVRTPADLIDFAGSDTNQVREILAEFGITQIAMISYLYGDQQVCFAALGDSRGHWHDLQRQELSIEVQLTREEKFKCPAPSTDATPSNT